jgi:Tat protein translocase TatB subunit
MLNVGPAELIVILLVALLIVGPKRLPEVGKSVGKALREIRRQTDEVRSSFEATLDPGLGDDIRDGTGITEPVADPVEEWGGEEWGDEDLPPTAATGPRDPDPGTAGPS